jgi:hypothetical protein
VAKATFVAIFNCATFGATSSMVSLINLLFNTSGARC